MGVAHIASPVSSHQTADIVFASQVTAGIGVANTAIIVSHQTTNIVCANNVYGGIAVSHSTITILSHQTANFRPAIYVTSGI